MNHLLGGTQSWTNNSPTSRLSILGAIDTPNSVNATLTIAGTGTTAIAGGILGGAGRVIGVTKSATGTLLLSGDSTLLGAMSITGGTLRVERTAGSLLTCPHE